MFPETDDENLLEMPRSSSSMRPERQSAGTQTPASATLPSNPTQTAWAVVKRPLELFTSRNNTPRGPTMVRSG